VLGLGRRLPFPSAPNLMGAVDSSEMKWIACPSTEPPRTWASSCARARLLAYTACYFPHKALILFRAAAYARAWDLRSHCPSRSRTICSARCARRNSRTDLRLVAAVAGRKRGTRGGSSR
jgi:hypothetical protein